LRFWEKHFPFLTPARSSGGHRYYNSEQLQVIETLKQLLYVEGYTIEGAKKKLAQDAPEQPENVLKTIKDSLIEIKNLLK
jgi:DNA-binding transcriptional MerR regulator